MNPAQVNQLARVFAVLGPDLVTTPVPVTPDIHERLDAGFDGFRGHVLVSEFGFSEPWPTWERHPAGDETVILLSGDATLTLRAPEGDQRVRLASPGDYVIVPRNTWHTAYPHVPTRMIFITPGERTENADTPPRKKST